MIHRLISTSTLFFLLSPLASAQAPEPEQETLWGHSAHGASYDQGPRQKPWRMEGIGSTPFPITSTNPEVQEWFDQAITLMHGFWWYEAERSLRWCLKLDPECAMAYWALSIATGQGGGERSGEFLQEAVDRIDTVTERERAFIRMSEAFQAVREAEDSDKAQAEAMVLFDRLLMDYPDDVEAKALYWLNGSRAYGLQAGLVRYGMEAVLDDILELDPDHVGALHYRVHNWDGKEGHYAVNSCMQLPEIAPACGHLLHMPGHVLSGIGLWHEAAIAMDRATRVEKAYMSERLIMPEDNWDYAHNLNYLSYIQEQLGMVDQALLGGEQLLKAPAFRENPMFASLTKVPTMRALLKFERWEELLDDERIGWDPENPLDQIYSKLCRLQALIGLERLEEAEDLLDELRSSGKQESADSEIPPFIFQGIEDSLKGIEAQLLIAQGSNLEGLALLTEAAAHQEENWHNDPPEAAHFLYNVLGDTYLELGAPKLAAECYEKTLETVFHDGFAVAGLVVAYHQLGETEKAREARAKLGVIWSDAQPNRWLAAANATGIRVAPHLEAPLEQRNYKKEVLDVVGPSLWVPGFVPELIATNAEGEEVSLADYTGQNVLLVFYLGDECVHCIEQLGIAEERLEGLEALDAVVLAVSKDTVDEIAAQQEDFGLTLLSDVEFENARRFHSFDDFEEIELHSTFLITKDGRLHWSTIGGEPFTDFDYIENELKRMNRTAEVKVATTR